MTRCNTLVLGLVLLLAGCAGDSAKTLASRLDPLVGQPESEVRRRMGPPTREATAAGGATVLHYVVDFPSWGGPNFTVGYGNPTGRACDIALRFEAGRMAGYSFTGDVCGVGGLPFIAP